MKQTFKQLITQPVPNRTWTKSFQIPVFWPVADSGGSIPLNYPQWNSVNDFPANGFAASRTLHVSGPVGSTPTNTSTAIITEYLNYV